MPADYGASMIETRGLTKRFGGNLAVDQLTFQVRPGKVTGFLGPNGAGKSTTIRMIVGLDRPSAGGATIGGKPFGALRDPLRHVGALLDPKYVHPGRSAWAHLLSLAQANRIPKRRVNEVLGMVGMESVRKRRAGKFSLGMSQRLGIAAALLGDPAVLIFDEPVNGLDPEGIRWIRDLMKMLARQGRTVFVSSHLMSEMALTADDLLVIGMGRLIAHTTVEEFVARNADGYIKVRTPRVEELSAVLTKAGATAAPQDDFLRVTGLPIEQIAEIATQAGIPVYELSPQTGSLEDAYLRMTGGAVQYHASMGGPQFPPQPMGGPGGYGGPGGPGGPWPQQQAQPPYPPIPQQQQAPQYPQIPQQIPQQQPQSPPPSQPGYQEQGGQSR
jgi:ABC-2 type transport system ATP-binding protein